MTTTAPAPLALVSRAFGVLAGLLLLSLALLTVADVASRNLWDRSIVGTVDISTVLLVAIAFLGLAQAELDGRHVRVEILEQRLSPAWRRALGLVRVAVLVLLGALLVWGLGDSLLGALDRGETTNDILRLPTWPARAALVLSFACFFVAALYRELRLERAGTTRGAHA